MAMVNRIQSSEEFSVDLFLFWSSVLKVVNYNKLVTVDSLLFTRDEIPDIKRKGFFDMLHMNFGQKTEERYVSASFV